MAKPVIVTILFVLTIVGLLSALTVGEAVVVGDPSRPDYVNSSDPNTFYGLNYRSSDDFVGNVVANFMSGGMIAIVISCTATVAVMGVSVFGSGLKEHSARVASNIIFYSALFALVSAFSITALITIPYLGWLFYSLFCVAYYVAVWGDVNNA